jgi:hypothetical protein
VVSNPVTLGGLVEDLLRPDVSNAAVFAMIHLKGEMVSEPLELPSP